MRLPAMLTVKVGRTILKMKKQSPHIFFVGGVIGSVTSTVLACRATLKLPETLDHIQNELHKVKELKESVSQPALLPGDYDDMDYAKDLAHIYTMAGLTMVKLYGPTVLVGAASIGMLTGSHVQMTKRNSALMAAYAAVQKAYDDYRERVRQTIGEDHELDFYRGVTEEVSVDGDKKKQKVIDPSKGSPYARVFDEYTKNWTKDPEINLMFIRCQMNYANQLLQTRGHIFLNEVYDMLGLDRSTEGAVVGWVKDNGDNHVDFGLYEAHNFEFVSGNERSVWLDFNVDGVIYDKI